jgi:uncharacterized protein
MSWWRGLTRWSRAGGGMTTHPYVVVALLMLLILGAFVLLGPMLAYPVLAIIAIVILTRAHWWRRIGFTYSRRDAPRLLLFVPVLVLPALWWLVVAPRIGYGQVHISSLALLAFYAGFTLLIGFVEEVYFRGLMLQALKPRGIWPATVFISLLFGVSHSLNVLAGAAPLYTLLQLGYATAFGLAFAALVWVTGLIWPVILAHALTDFAAALNSAGGLISTTVTPTDYAITAFSVLFFTTYAVILLATVRGKEAPPKQLS